MSIATTQPLNGNGLQLDFHLTTQLGISRKDARREVLRYCMDYLSLQITPEHDLFLLIHDQNHIVWRVPIVLILGRKGRLGSVGYLDVDAFSGELIVIDEQIEEILAHANRLAKSAFASTIA